MAFSRLPLAGYIEQDIRILNHIGEPTTPPKIASARAPPVEWDTDFDQTPLQESGQPESVSEFEYDHTVTE